MYLEQRYIRLLESRITQLEQRNAVVETTKPAAEDVVLAEAKNTDGDSSSGNDSSYSSSKDNADNPDSKADVPEVEKEPRYVVVVSRWDPDLGDFTNIDATKKEEKKAIGPENQRAFTFKKLTLARSQQSESEPYHSEAKIESEPLQKLLGKITSRWGWSEKVTECSSPYSGLIYAWTEAMQEVKVQDDNESDDEKQARTDLGELLKIISTSSGFLPIDRYFKNREAFINEKTITHAALWTLFPPGTVIYAQPFLGEPQVFTVYSCNGFVTEDEDFDLVCFCFDWNGAEFTRVPFMMSIPYWGSDKRSIVELPFYPVKYYTNPGTNGDTSPTDAFEALRERLIARGKKFVKYCVSVKGKQMFKYTGNTHFHTGRNLLHASEDADGEQKRQSDDSSTGTGVGGLKASNQARSISRKKIDGGTTMVDFDSFFEYLSPRTPILGNLRRYEGELESLSPERRANPIFKEIYKFHWDRLPAGHSMTPDQYLHCPPRVLGYALKQKKWAQLLVDGLRSPDAADATVFEEKLQLDEEAKNLVKWSVQAHEEGKKLIDGKPGESRGLQDFAPDKGKGLVIMLYGFPGVGKTLTAESVALMAGKPLLSVGVSDIGIEGDKVEANLQKVFDLAGKWEAVLLFDEADVFLEARGDGENDLQRNAMVSDIAIKYDELDSDQQFAIFESFLDQLRRKKLVEDYEDLISWAKKDGKKLALNGRQIRNIVSTAMNIALVDNKSGMGKLKREHLSRVAKQTKDFKQELRTQEDIYRAKTK
ncbi:hypothetical protein J4E82_002258 [Alternaria postmessia]|uniref:uncharacterized protein n=1 Tax=Alternaria postmessia TaxID=1187938 RepID=UPI002225082B|nr:uncharacterized protein J4E82_002258 [Alternaria postmessia]KAI5378807.1 hypothetical protein J4E82_002258 [Alternaria postmessia]